VKAHSAKEQQWHKEDQLSYKCHKPGCRMSRCHELHKESSDKVDKQD
jgi:hypothetical protein